jgi:hypothetical protein
MRNFRGPALDTFCERTSYQMPKPITGPGSTTGTDSVEPQNHRATREIPRQDDDPKPMSDVTFTEAQQRISNVANNPTSLQAFYQQIASDTVKGSNRPLPLRPDQSDYNVLGSKINWDNTQEAKILGGSANLVCRFTDNNNQKLYLKFQQEGAGARAMLADSVLRDLGIPSPQSKVVRLYQEDGKTLTPEGSAIIDQLNKQLKKDYPNSTRSDMDYWLEAKNNPREIVVSNELPGNTIGSFLQSASDQEKLKLFKSQNFQKDLGVLIGADAFLGNSDRVSYRPSVEFNGQPSPGWFHPGNFLLGAYNRIHSLDNEALFPSKRAQGSGGLQTLLDGGELKINAKDFDPSVEQPHYPSLQMFANPNSVKEAVRKALGELAEPDETGHKPVNFSDQDLDEIVNGIAPHVTDTIKQLSEASKEGKLRGGPLNERVKTEAKTLTNNDGLVYDQFKIRSRFAGMVANQNT